MTHAMRTLVAALAMAGCGAFLFFLAVWWHKPTWNDDDWAVVESVQAVRQQHHHRELGVWVENYATGITTIPTRPGVVLVSSESRRTDRGLLEQIDADGTATIVASVEPGELPAGVAFGSSVTAMPAVSPEKLEFLVGGGLGHTDAYSRHAHDGGVWMVNAMGAMSFIPPPTASANVGCSLSYATEASDCGAWVAVGASHVDEGFGAVYLLHVSPSGETTWHEACHASKLDVAFESDVPFFGASVACLDVDRRGVATIAVGAPGVWTDKGVYGVHDKGWVGIFEWSEGRDMELTRVVTPTQDIDAGAYVRHFGRSLAWDGTALVVGSQLSPGFSNLSGVQPALATLSDSPSALWCLDTTNRDSTTVGINLGEEHLKLFYVELGRTLASTRTNGEILAGSYHLGSTPVWRLRLTDPLR